MYLLVEWQGVAGSFFLGGGAGTDASTPKGYLTPHAGNQGAEGP